VLLLPWGHQVYFSGQAAERQKQLNEKSYRYGKLSDHYPDLSSYLIHHLFLLFYSKENKILL
jgi:hypothetical protein